MALINTAAILAGRGFRVLVIDFDLEAPGLSYLARTVGASQGTATDSTMPLGLIDLLNDAKERGLESDLFARPMQEVADIYTRPYPLENPEVGGALFIMPAGKMDQGYTKRFDDLSLRELYGEGVGEPLMRIFKEKFAESDLYDYVLIDSRTGFSDEAGICTQDLADFMMIFSGLNKQNIEGTAEFLQALRFASEGKAKFQIILSPVPMWEEDLLAAREKIAQERFNQAWSGEVDLSLQIPYHPRLALTEEPQVFGKNGGALLAAYHAIERGMLRGLGHNARGWEQELNDKLNRMLLGPQPNAKKLIQQKQFEYNKIDAVCRLLEQMLTLECKAIYQRCQKDISESATRKKITTESDFMCFATKKLAMFNEILENCRSGYVEIMEKRVARLKANQDSPLFFHKNQGFAPLFQKEITAMNSDMVAQLKFLNALEKQFKEVILKEISVDA